MTPVHRLLLLLICFQIISSSGWSQSPTGIQAKIIDSKTNESIPFATVKLFANGKVIGGVVSNQDGDFQLPAKDKITPDSIVISCIGYSNLALTWSALSDRQINTLKLREGSVRLKEVVIIGGKKLTARKIVQLGTQHIGDNYPRHPYAYMAYYRDYQMEQNQYVNLNEAIIEVFDKGFDTNDVQTTREKLFSYRENKTFPRDSLTLAPYELNKNKFIPGVRLFSFGGNELSILRIHDALRNNQSTTYSFVNVFRKDFVRNHSFKLLGTVYLNHVALYKIGIQAIPAVSGPNHAARGEIYIEHGNYAIHKLWYAAYERKSNEEKLLYSVELEYARSDAHMYLNYISCNNFFLSKRSDGFAVTEILFDKELKAFIIHFSHAPAARSATRPGNYHFILDGDRIDFDNIEFNPRDDKEVILRVGSRQASEITDVTKINASFKDIKDKLGRDINDIAYKEVNQFRELFFQKLIPEESQPEAGRFMDANLPLKRNEIDSTKNSSGYWMNSPLKK